VPISPKSIGKDGSKVVEARFPFASPTLPRLPRAAEATLACYAPRSPKHTCKAKATSVERAIRSAALSCDERFIHASERRLVSATILLPVLHDYIMQLR